MTLNVFIDFGREAVSAALDAMKAIRFDNTDGVRVHAMTLY